MGDNDGTRAQALLREKEMLEHQLAELMAIQALPTAAQAERLAQLELANDRNEGSEETMSKDLERLRTIKETIETLQKSYNDGNKDPEALAHDLESIMFLGRELDQLSKVVSDAQRDEFDDDNDGEAQYEEENREESSDNEDPSEGQREHVSEDVDPAQLLEIFKSLPRGEENGHQFAIENLLQALSQSTQPIEPPESPRIVEIPMNSAADMLESHSQAAQTMLAEVQELKREIVMLRDSESSDPRVREAQEERYMQLVSKMEDLEQRRLNFASFIAAARNEQNTETNQSVNIQNEEERKTHLAQADDVPPASQGEIRKVMAALEHARELGRAKNLQLKRQEQEVATLQRNIESMERRLGTLQPLGDENSLGADKREGASSVKVEPSLSVRQARSSESVLSNLYEEDQDDCDQVREDQDSRHVARSRDDNTQISDDGDVINDKDDETDDDFNLVDMSALKEQPRRVKSLRVAESSQSSTAENMSTTGRAGSTIGDSRYEESVASNGWERAVAKSERGGSSNTSMRSFLNDQVRSPSKKYLGNSDWGLLLSNVHDLFDDWRSRDTDSEVDDREFGREVFNLLTKVLSELGHVDVTSQEKRRQIIRSLRQLSQDC